MSTCAVGEKAVIPNANQSGRKHVQQEAAKELVDIQGQDLLGVAMCVVAITEADTFAVEGDDSGVADGNAVGVVSKISENCSGPPKGGLQYTTQSLAPARARSRSRATESASTRSGSRSVPSRQAWRREPVNRVRKRRESTLTGRKKVACAVERHRRP